MPVEIRYAARSDIGLVRKQNQDSGYAGQHLLVLADGMGGPAGGDIASSVAVAHLAPLDQDAHTAEDMLPALMQKLNEAHDELIERSKADPELEGLGTTCIAVLRSGRKMAMVHIGDSRAYMLRDGHLSQVTKDHSFVQYLIDSGKITPEQAQNHPQKSVILRVLGDSEDPIFPDESLREATPGDRWLLCSDGLSGVVSGETIQSVLTEYEDLDECADKLVELALRGGGPDNVTVVLFDILDHQQANQQVTPQVVGAAATDRLAQTRGAQSAAGRAAALAGASRNANALSDPEEEKLKEQKKRQKRRRSIAYAAGVLVFLGALGLGTWQAYQWTQTQYYAIAEGDQVVIYQGIPQRLGSLTLAHPVEVKTYRTSDLMPATRNRLSTPVVRSSRDELEEYLAQLVAQDSWERLNDASLVPQVQLPPSPSQQVTPNNEEQPAPTPAPTPMPTPNGNPG
ncbi:serine/threonine protein phosphatase [Boudabousia tangfeifanii]|uniref:Serine/threonine protein phosphatase PstP n=1 Tax=Boudabousia tangfeifanii TaxID=1912795 RepID=A0A1D9MHZ9_9ACTO|nr:Stp1/IreP family PP2C-type Ser/Thr phosphatase [Boudabousia tangfeifanii]AOZ71886.1 serine/threonine protein phosphatase [Boudabousia tangfeifanii]